MTLHDVAVIQKEYFNLLHSKEFSKSVVVSLVRSFSSKFGLDESLAQCIVRGDISTDELDRVIRYNNIKYADAVVKDLPSDLISRRKAILCAVEVLSNHGDVNDIKYSLASLPSEDVNPVVYGTCSVCGFEKNRVSDCFCSGFTRKSKFCPECGANMLYKEGNSSE